MDARIDLSKVYFIAKYDWFIFFNGYEVFVDKDICGEQIIFCRIESDRFHPIKIFIDNKLKAFLYHINWYTFNTEHKCGVLISS